MLFMSVAIFFGSKAETLKPQRAEARSGSNSAPSRSAADHLVVVFGTRRVLRADQGFEEVGKARSTLLRLLLDGFIVIAPTGNTPLIDTERSILRQVAQLHQIAFTEEPLALFQVDLAIMVVIESFEHALGNCIGGVIGAPKACSGELREGDSIPVVLICSFKEVVDVNLRLPAAGTSTTDRSSKIL